MDYQIGHIRRQRHTLLFCLGTVAAIGFGLGAMAEPQITAAALRNGNSPRLTANSWAYLTYTLRNPDSEEVSVRLSLRPANQGAQAIFEKDIRLAPHTFLKGRELVTASPVDDYTLSLFRGEERIERATVVSRHTDPLEQYTVYVINDDPDFGGTSDLMRSQAFPARAVVITCTAKDAPHHWTGYGDSHVVAIAGPAYRNLTAMQYSALLEFVHRGGSVAFIDPVGAMGAGATPWRELLPGTPIGIRRIEESPPLDQWGDAWYRAAARHGGARAGARSRFEAPEGIPFLELVPNPECRITLAQDEFPVCCWQRHGLGRTVAVAVNACTPLVKESALFIPLWQHILYLSQAPFALSYHENSRLLHPLMGQLTGFRIPPVASVARLLCIYVLFLGIVLIGGYALRRHVAAWCLTAFSGILFTAWIFLSAFRQSADRPPHLASVLDLCTSTAQRTSGHAVIGLFSREDIRPTLRDSNPDNGLRALPPAVRGTRKSPLDAPLMVRRNGDNAELPGIYVQALKPRHIASVYTKPSDSSDTVPLVTMGREGLAITPYELPKRLKSATSAWILLPNGLLRTDLRNGTCTNLATAASGFEADTFQRALKDYLACGRFPAPALVVLEPWNQSLHSFSLNLEPFQPQGFHVELLPLDMAVTQTEVLVPAQMYSIAPATAFARLATQNGLWTGSTLRQPSLTLPLRVEIPPILAAGSITSASVCVEIANPGGNISVEAAFARQSLLCSTAAVLPDDMGWREGIPATRQEGSVLFFDNLLEKDMPSYLTDGSLFLLLRLSQRQYLRDHADAERANAWKILRLEMETVTLLPNAKRSEESRHD